MLLYCRLLYCRLLYCMLLLTEPLPKPERLLLRLP